MDRNWGPAGISGIPLSDYGYNAVEAGFDVGVETVRLPIGGADLTDELDSLGLRVHRYFFAHRLRSGRGGGEPGALGDDACSPAWIANSTPGSGTHWPAPVGQPVRSGRRRQLMFGFDGEWRVARAHTLEAQLGLDDLQYENTRGKDRYPNRWAFTLAASGPLAATPAGGRSTPRPRVSPFGPSTRSRALPTTASASAGTSRTWTRSRPRRPCGRNSLAADAQLTLQRQGEGEINDPFPATAAEAGAIPQLFIGVVEHTYRAAVGVSGRQGPLDLRASAGMHHVVNADIRRVARSIASRAGCRRHWA